MNNLQKRVLSSIVLAPLVAAIIFYGGTFFLIFMAAAFLLSIYEWRMMSLKTKDPFVFLCFGGLYITISFLILTYMRFLPETGLGLVITFFICLWSSDSLAYLFGKGFGGPKLAPRISPNKTIAGMIGAVTGSIVAFLLCNHFFLFLAPLTITNFSVLMLAGVIMGIVAQIGDLLISIMKRYISVKDTGHLIPGHGGILDRVDSMLPAVPLFYCIVNIFF